MSYWTGMRRSPGSSALSGMRSTVDFLHLRLHFISGDHMAIFDDNRDLAYVLYVLCGVVVEQNEIGTASDL